MKFKEKNHIFNCRNITLLFFIVYFKTTLPPPPLAQKITILSPKNLSLTQPTSEQKYLDGEKEYLYKKSSFDIVNIHLAAQCSCTKKTRLAIVQYLWSKPCLSIRAIFYFYIFHHLK